MRNGYENVEEFLHENKVSFEQLIRCFNFWESLSREETKQAIEDYNNGYFDTDYRRDS